MGPVEALRQTGYAVLPALYDEAFLERARQAIVRIYEQLGSPPLRRRGKSELGQAHAILSGSGLMIGQLLAHAPELVDGYLHPVLLDALEQSLGPNFRIETTAGTVSDRHRNDVLGWHNHIGGLDEDLERPIDYATLEHDRIRRVTVLIYLDELSDEGGPLFVSPRTLADPIPCPYPEHEPRVDWDGAAVVTGPPGTVVILEERTWHASLARKLPGFRRFVGAIVAAQWAPPNDNVDGTVARFADRLLAR